MGGKEKGRMMEGGKEGRREGGGGSSEQRRERGWEGRRKEE